MSSASVSIARRLLFVAWIVYLISFLLPATTVVEMPGSEIGEPLRGYEAFALFCRGGLHLFIVLAYPVVLILYPIVLIGSVYSAASPFLIESVQQQPMIGIIAGCASLAGSVAAILIPTDLKEHTLVGYHFWWVSMLIIGVVTLFESIRIRRPVQD